VTETMQIRLDLDPKTAALLDRLKNITRAVSYAEVVERALRNYENVINDRQQQGQSLRPAQHNS
jgi:hypothetical protein